MTVSTISPPVFSKKSNRRTTVKIKKERQDVSKPYILSKVMNRSPNRWHLLYHAPFCYGKSRCMSKDKKSNANMLTYFGGI